MGFIVRGTMPRSAVGVVITLVAMLVAFSGPVLAQPDGKVFVCKYVGEPGEEVLQTGDNPISVSVNSIPAFKDFEGPIEDLVGEVFTDQQGPSLVLEVDIGQAEPAAECPLVPPPTEVTPLAPTVTEATCEAAGTLVIPEVEGVIYTVDPEYTAGATGEFTITATAAEGFVLDTEAETMWTLTVEAQLTGEECEETGTIIVDKVVTGTGASTTEEFAINVTGQAGLMLSADDEAATLEVAAGASYSGTETLTAAQTAAGWTLTGIVCTSDMLTGTLPASFMLGDGETVTCVVTNAFTAPVVTPPTGSITIVKDADPADGTDFAFSVTGGLSAFALDDDDDDTLSNTITFDELGAGLYTVTELAIDGWELEAIECTGTGMADLDTATVSIQLAAGADVTCTFSNVESEDELPGEEVPPTRPREGTLGGNPLPNTAMTLESSTGIAPAALMVLVMLGGLGAAAAAVHVEARRRS